MTCIDLTGTLELTGMIDNIIHNLKAHNVPSVTQHRLFPCDCICYIQLCCQFYHQGATGKHTQKLHFFYLYQDHKIQSLNSRNFFL